MNIQAAAIERPMRKKATILSRGTLRGQLGNLSKSLRLSLPKPGGDRRSLTGSNGAVEPNQSTYTRVLLIWCYQQNRLVDTAEKYL